MSLSLTVTSEAIFDRALSFEVPQAAFNGVYYIPSTCEWAFEITLGFRFYLRYSNPNFENPFKMAQCIAKELKAYLNPLWC